MEYSEYNSEIKTVDAQESYNNGVLVLVTGYLTGKDNIKKNFTQSFLAPQDKGYFVLNDVFRYVDEADQQQQQQPENQVSTNVPEVPLSHEDGIWLRFISYCFVIVHFSHLCCLLMRGTSIATTLLK